MAARDTRELRQVDDSRKTIEEAHQVIGMVKDDDEIITSINEELLVKCISQNLGYFEGKPVAACLIYRCLIHWRSFEYEETNIFNHITQTIASAVEVPDNNEILVYWLSNLAMLLCLMQRTFTSVTILPSQGCMRAATVSSFDRKREVVPKKPGILFMQQLTEFIEKIYGIIRNNLKKDISPLLLFCIQEARINKNTVPYQQQALFDHWQSIAVRLSSYLNLMKANNVPPLLVSKVFIQVFSLINVQIFNSLLLWRGCCTYTNGKYVEAGLAKIEEWCLGASDEYVSSAWNELGHIKQAASFLVIHQKRRMTLEEITREICPVLSLKHIYRLSTMYWDDKYGTHSVSSDVIKEMRIIMQKSINVIGNPFILEDDSSIPFTVEDVTNSMKEVDVNFVELPQSIRENAGFSFSLAHEEASPS